MKTKQQNLRAKFTTEQSNAKNYNSEKSLDKQYLIIDKKTEKMVIDCRIYSGFTRNASTVYASIWVNLTAKKKPQAWRYGYVSGAGSAGGYGYDKNSGAVCDALRSAGIELYGVPYAAQSGVVADFKKRAYINGVGESAIRSALLATAYAAGFNDVILVG